MKTHCRETVKEPWFCFLREQNRDCASHTLAPREIEKKKKKTEQHFGNIKLHCNSSQKKFTLFHKGFVFKSMFFLMCYIWRKIYNMYIYLHTGSKKKRAKKEIKPNCTLLHPLLLEAVTFLIECHNFSVSIQCFNSVLPRRQES